MLELIASLCASTGHAVGAALPSGPAALVPALALVGLTGGALHCAPMCGAFVLAQTSDRLAAIPAARLCERHRIEAAALPSYHLGRIGVYTALGAVAGGIGEQLTSQSWLAWLSTALLLMAGLYFLAQALAGLLPAFPARGASAWVRRRLTPALGALRAYPGGPFRRGLATGLLLGLLPCGFLYAAVAVAAASASAITGAAAMLGFGLGTVPSLLVVGWLGAAGGRRWQGWVGPLRPYLMLVAAALLVTLAVETGLAAG